MWKSLQLTNMNELQGEIRNAKFSIFYGNQKRDCGWSTPSAAWYADQVAHSVKKCIYSLGEICLNRRCKWTKEKHGRKTQFYCHLWHCMQSRDDIVSRNELDGDINAMSGREKYEIKPKQIQFNVSPNLMVWVSHPLHVVDVFRHFVKKKHPETHPKVNSDAWES